MWPRGSQLKRSSATYAPVMPSENVTISPSGLSSTALRMVVSLVKMYSFAVIGKHPIQIANVALVGDSKLAFALGGCNRLIALCADRVDGGITILPSGEGSKTGHKRTPWESAG